MEGKVVESTSLGTSSNLKENTVEIMLLRIIFVIIIAVTSIFSYALYKNVKLHLICSDVKCLASNSTSIMADEYNRLVDKIDSEGYNLSYAVEKDSKIISEKSGKIEGTVPLASGDILVLTFTQKTAGDNNIVFKEYLNTKIE